MEHGDKTTTLQEGLDNAGESGPKTPQPSRGELERRRAKLNELLNEDRWYGSIDTWDWLFASLAMLIAFVASVWLIDRELSGYEKFIYVLSVATSIFVMWIFKSMRWFLLAATVLSGAALYLYHGDLGMVDRSFMLKYLLSSQSAIMWQCALTILAFFSFLVGFVLDWRRKGSVDRDNFFVDAGVVLAWISSCLGLVGLLVRWYESYLLPQGIGHIPLTNIYEVFVLFIIIVPIMFLYYARSREIKRLGVFVWILQLILVGFVVWYSLERGGQEIQPLVPALNSWWLKLHVPANFVAYGGFCIAAMLAIAELLAIRGEERAKADRALGKTPSAKKGFWASSEVIETIMYKCIAVGFFFFTIATILGALWAEDAWGRYWSWDPKETWALVVWINYAAWLHMRFIKGLRGKVLAWWALSGFLVTSFAFVGVNFFLSGLHSYGGL